MVSAVKLRGDEPVFGAVFRHVGVEHVERDPPHGERPYLHPHGPAENLDVDEDRDTVLVRHLPDREVREVLVEPEAFLHSVLADLLAEIALPVEQREGDEWDVEIARRLAVIAREDAEAAGVIRHALVEAELGREIRERTALERRFGAQFSVSVLARHVGFELRRHLPHLAQEIVVLRHFREPRLAAELEHPERIVIGLVPEFVVEVAEKPACPRLPCPPEIQDQFPQRLELGGKFRHDVKRVDRLHRYSLC